jgi:protein N-lysine methyltransferase METTL21A
MQRLLTTAGLSRGEALEQDIMDFQPDVILAADCVYFEPAFPLLLSTLSDLLTLCPSATIYFCFKKRRRADMHFIKKVQKAFHVAEVYDEDRPVFSRQGLFLYAITSKSSQQCQ